MLSVSPQEARTDQQMCSTPGKVCISSEKLISRISKRIVNFEEPITIRVITTSTQIERNRIDDFSGNSDNGQLGQLAIPAAD